MYIKKCPKCGRLPKIQECVSFTEIRKRFVHCPNYCNVLISDHNNKIKTWGKVIHGNMDDNTIYKIWNEALIDG